MKAVIIVAIIILLVNAGLVGVIVLGYILYLKSPVESEYRVEITLKEHTQYEIICPIALPLNSDYESFTHKLDILNGSGSATIIRVNDTHPDYDNLTTTERGDHNLYGLHIISSTSMTIYLTHESRNFMVMTLDSSDYWLYLDSDIENNTAIEIWSVSESANDGQLYSMDEYYAVNGWQQITIEDRGWVD